MSFDTERFISEIQNRPCIWNMSSEEYSNRVLKQSNWNEVADIIYDEWQNLEENTKQKRTKALQKKWKVLRDGFRRYVNKTKKIKSGSGAIKLRQYVYYHQLSFLLPLTEEKAGTEDSLENESTEDAVTEEKIPQRGRKRTSTSKEDNLITQLAINLNKKYNETTFDDKTDDDKLFLMALHGDFKKISDDYKLDAKTDILKVIKKYKVLSSDVNLYSNQTSLRSQFNYHQPSYSQFSHQSSSSYSQPSYDDFSSGYSTGPPQASTSRPLQTDITIGYSTGVPQACTS
ncbi:unnamed protein product [Parnassius apollo]|uniref:(apollo) hypothetical protein n=1 Tax=Parnassius apollo TaxID=110799 RepID=A0A8S3W297_PARAO|nr:unnamed protein product [Parnassius apollo]